MLDLHLHARRLASRGAPYRIEPALEVIYRDLFRRELAKLGEEDHFFPTGGAANYSLLYLILRIGTELHPKRVLDIGAGQSSLLWSTLHQHGLVGEVVTLENDAAWAERIGSRIEHRMIVTQLRTEIVNGRAVETYAWPEVLGSGPFDVIVCDGPRGLPRRSRSGVLALLDEALPPDFALIFDDAERIGEQDTIRDAHSRLQSLNRDYGVGIIRAAKSQAVFASGRFLPAIFM